MSNQQAVLYDAPGPRTRRITLVSSLLAAILVLIGAYFLVYKPLDAKGQFSMELWGPLVNPQHEYFNPVWHRLGEGFRATLTAAALAITSSLFLGTGLAILRVQLKALARQRFTGLAAPAGLLLRANSWLLVIVTRFFVEVFRGMPVVITIFFVSVALPQFGLDFGTALWYLVVGLTLYNMVVIGEILRSGMEGLPGGQREAAEALGLSNLQTTLTVLLPQSFRIMLPALIGQLVVVLKDTSLGFIISYEEVLRVSSQIIQAVDDPNPIQVYVVVGTLYIAVNYALSKLAQYAQGRIARGRKTPRAGVGAEAAPATAPLPAGTTVDSGLGGGFA
jgi:glutamate transport system permease protein